MIDDAARADIAGVLDRTLFVEAGAGTGKTSALVTRVVELLRRGATIDQLAVITFTEAAAAELRDRVRRALEAEAGAAATGWAGAALDDLDGAAISTLHGFAQRILSEHPLEAGLPPVIAVHSEIGAQVELERRWRAFLDSFLDDPDHEELVQRAVVCGLELRHLKVLATLLEDHWDRLEHMSTAVPVLAPVRAGAVVDPLRRAGDLATRCTADDDKMLGHLGELAPWVDRLAGTEDDLDRLHLLVDMPTLTKNQGRKGNWPDGCLDEVKELLRAAEDERQRLVAARVDEVLRRLVVALSRFALDGVAERRAAGHLRFHDLLVMCRDLLRGSPEVRRALRERYRHLLIDEFQDTDPIQIEIATLIASPDPDAGGRHWSEVAIDPGRLFFVGDAKQAIYRFRRADIALFLEVRDRLGAETRQLSTNFRTVPGIVEWVNHCFTQIMGEGVAGGQPAYHRLDTSRSPTDGGPPPVAMVGGPIDLPTAPERREVMSRDLAASLRQVVSEQWPVWDTEASRWRAPRWSDIAVLVPARTGLPEMRAALDAAGVPYRIEASSLVWVTQEVRELLATLRAVDDPSDSLSLVTALRSPAFGCGDDDLARFVAAGGRLDLTRPVPGAVADDDPVAVGISSLRSLHDAAVWDEPSALVERVIRERRLMELALASSRPRDVWRRLRFVADQARAYADAEGGTLRDFVRWADLQADESMQASARETILPETDDDAARIMTVHASKGLEFPIVVLAGLDRAPNETRPMPRVMWGDGPDPEVHVRKSLTTLGAAALSEADAEQEGYEAWRLMYVATTRARDHLVLCVHHKQDAPVEKCIAARLREAAATRPETWRALVPDASTPVLPETRGEPPSPVDSDEWQRRRAAVLADAGRPSAVAATAVAQLDPDEPDDHEHEPWRRGRAGTAVGRAVHGTLQTVDLATGDDLARVAAAQATAEGVPARTAEVEGAARAALGSRSVVAAARHRHWREIYLGASIEGVVCEGYVDLLVDGPDGLEVIDYKTDRTPDPGDLVERYRLQTATYALLVEATLGRPVRRCALVVLGEAGATEVEVDHLDAAMDEVRRRLREHGRPASQSLTSP